MNELHMNGKEYRYNTFILIPTYRRYDIVYLLTSIGNAKT